MRGNQVMPAKFVKSLCRFALAAKMPLEPSKIACASLCQFSQTFALLRLACVPESFYSVFRP